MAPLVISRRQNNTQRILARDERAEALGLTPGMGIADACAMYPDIDIIETDPDADLRLLESLADWCSRYTPLVALDGTHSLFLDISGCAHLFGGERTLLDDIVARLLFQGFDARASLAASPGAAWAAARLHGGHILDGGEEEAFLAPLPLWALRIEPDVCSSLESVGLRTVGAIMAAPRAPLARRFGKGPLLRLDQALGNLDEAISPRLPVPALSVERHLIEPLTRTDDIETLVFLLAASLKSDLERRGEGARMLQLMLFRVDGAVSRISVGTSRPMRDPQFVRRLFRERLMALEDVIDAGCGFDLARLMVVSAAAFDQPQADLSGISNDEGADLALFADRIGARLGEGAIMKSARVESHLPEHAVSVLPFAKQVAKKVGKTPEMEAAEADIALPWPERPIRVLRHPEPLDVPATEVPEGPPLRFHWRRALYRVERAEGPERIAPEWWSMPPDPKPREDDADDRDDALLLSLSVRLTRDYFRVEDTQGRRYWLYRQGQYASGHQPSWFMHGIFA